MSSKIMVDIESVDGDCHADNHLLCDIFDVVSDVAIRYGLDMIKHMLPDGTICFTVKAYNPEYKKVKLTESDWGLLKKCRREGLTHCYIDQIRGIIAIGMFKEIESIGDSCNFFEIETLLKVYDSQKF